MTTMTRRLTAALAALTLAAVPMLAQERSDPDKIGIKVHGHWTIDVRKADGTLVSHNEFENALTAGGAVGLGQVLSRAYTVGAWAIFLDGGACQGQVEANACLIMEPVTSNPLKDSSDLSVSVPPWGQSNNGMLVFKGSVKAQFAGQITQVRTRQSPCQLPPGQELTGSQCAASATMVYTGNVFDLTSRNLSPAIAVDAGQFIQVTVVISFS